VDLGLFEDEGIDLQIEGGGGSPAVAGVSSGSVDMAGSNVVSVIMARHQGLPITMIAPGTFASEEPEDDFSAIVVTEESGIEEATDLAGASIAVDQLQNIGEITIRSTLEESGVDTDTLTYVELGFPTMEQALRSGDVDAAWIIEPFATQALAGGGLHVVAYPYAETHPGLQIGSIITSEDYAAEHPDVVSAFQRAHAATASAITDDPEAFRSALIDLTDMDPDVAASFHLPTWSDAIAQDSLELINQQMIAFGLLDETIPLDDLVHDGQ
jgi:NitT/TauT family transport system substrate-binding protein